MIDQWGQSLKFRNLLIWFVECIFIYFFFFLMYFLCFNSQITEPFIYSFCVSGEGPHLATSREPAWRGAGGAQGEKEAAAGRGGRGQAKREEHLGWRRGQGANVAGWAREGKERGTDRMWLWCADKVDQYLIRPRAWVSARPRAVRVIEFSISITIVISDDYENRIIEIKRLLCLVPFRNVLVLSF